MLSYQAIFGKGLPLGTPIDVQWACSPANISLLRAVDCLYYSNGMQDWIRYVWAVGLLAAGQSSTMTVRVCVCVCVCVCVWVGVGVNVVCVCVGVNGCGCKCG